MSEPIYPASDIQFLTTDSEIEYAIKVMRAKTAAYIMDNQLKSLVIGISGGVDSAFAAALLRPVCDFTNTKLIGRSITVETNKEDEIERSKQIGVSFCHDFQYVDYTSLYNVYKEVLPDIDADLPINKLRMGNCKARIRMICLYDLAQMNKGIVISTDNFTEYLTGFWTLHGDVGDFAPFINLWKTEIYAATRFLCNQLTKEQADTLIKCIEAVPTDGLGISVSDLEQLKVDSYQEADRILAAYLQGDKTKETHPVVERFLATSYKRKIPICIGRTALLNKE
ncbi:MAG: NAD(+) synthase [Bacteroidales bacterium]|jgi:NAD+ synthetase|nr:NAD(+) synthase [Bacteroidales bacterium]